MAIVVELGDVGYIHDCLVVFFLFFDVKVSGGYLLYLWLRFDFLLGLIELVFLFSEFVLVCCGGVSCCGLIEFFYRNLYF